MTPSRWLIAFVASSALGLGAPGCDGGGPARSTLEGWPPGEPLEAGACRFRLTSATLYHSTEWHLGVEIEAENTGSEAVKCGFSAQAMTSVDTPLTDAAKGSGMLPPTEGWSKRGQAREADTTGLSKGPAEGAWVYIEVSEGRWPLAETTGVQITPERIRPPD